MTERNGRAQAHLLDDSLAIEQALRMPNQRAIDNGQWKMGIPAGLGRDRNSGQLTIDNRYSFERFFIIRSSTINVPT